MHEMYSDPVLEAYVKKKDEQKEVELIECPACQSLNSPRARRCGNRPDDPPDITIPRDAMNLPPIKNYSVDGRCEWFFAGQFNLCKHCQTPNDKMARDCRNCGETLVDPNKNLLGKHYTDDDWRTVKSMRMALTKNPEIVSCVSVGPAILILFVFANQLICSICFF